VSFENSADVYGTGFKIVNVPVMPTAVRSHRTFYNRHGDVFGWGCVVLTAAFASMGLLTRRPDQSGR
jgi:hypothetical protein